MILTYYDIIKRVRKPMLEYVKKDLEYLKENNVSSPSGTYNPNQKVLPNFYEYIEDSKDKVMQSFILNAGISEESAKKYLQRDKFKKQLEEATQVWMYEYFSYLNFELCGKKTFYFNHNLIENLFYTDLNAPSTYLKLPFSSCLFMYDSPIAIESFYKISTNGKTIRNVPISVFVTELPAEEGNRKLIFNCWQADLENSYSFVKRELLIRNDWKITDMLRTDWNEIYADEEFEDEDKVFFEEGLDFFRIIINSILYLSSNDVDLINKISPRKKLEDKLERISSKSKIKKTKKRLKKNTELDYQEIGGNSKKIVVKKPNNSTESISPSNKKLAKRFMVRGHWRNQPYGKRNKKRKLIFIEPYVKGPEMAELINKPYEVK